MKTLQITLPDDLAHSAESAGLLSSDAMAAMLREQLRRQAGAALREAWDRGPQDALSQGDELEIVEQVKKLRAEHRSREKG
jgi:hypothetical protein